MNHNFNYDNLQNVLSISYNINEIIKLFCNSVAKLCGQNNNFAVRRNKFIDS